MNQNNYTVNKYQRPSSILTEMELLTSINYSFYTTVYFYEPKNKIIFPVDVDNELGDSSIYKLMEKILNFSGIQLGNLQIVGDSENLKGTHLILEQNDSLIRFPISMLNGIKLAFHLQLQVLIEASVLQKHGIKITKKLIEESLTNY